MNRPVLSNTEARRLFLDRHALLEPPTGPAKGDDLLALIRRLGFIQV
ncbi:MAG: winged helix-turn-helix domain-containing protein, partial [Albidovulum sp.]